jgi:hypothetical protein
MFVAGHWQNIGRAPWKFIFRSVGTPWTGVALLQCAVQIYSPFLLLWNKLKKTGRLNGDTQKTDTVWRLFVQSKA